MEADVLAVGDERRLLLVAGGGHLRAHVLVAEDDRAHLAEVLVPAGVIGVHVGVDEEADRLGRELLDRSDDLVGQRRELVVDEEDAVGAGEDADVPAGALEIGDLAGNGVRP